MPTDYSAYESRPYALRTFRLLAGLLAAVVLAQGALAGQFLFTEPDARAAHRVVGIALSALALAVAVQGWRVRYKSTASWWLAFALLVMVIAMTGLGFAGRKNPTAAATHIPLGVATFGVAVAAAVLDRPPRY